MMCKAYKGLILTVEQQKRRPVKSAISIDCNQFNYLIIKYLLADAKVLKNISQHLIRLNCAAHDFSQVIKTFAKVL